VFQKKWRQNSNHYNYGISYQN